MQVPNSGQATNAIALAVRRLRSLAPQRPTEPKQLDKSENSKTTKRGAGVLTYRYPRSGSYATADNRAGRRWGIAWERRRAMAMHGMWLVGNTRQALRVPDRSPTQSGGDAGLPTRHPPPTRPLRVADTVWAALPTPSRARPRRTITHGTPSSGIAVMPSRPSASLWTDNTTISPAEPRADIRPLCSSSETSQTLLAESP